MCIFTFTTALAPIHSDGNEYVLTGQKQFISGGGATDVLVVMARTGGDGPKGISTFIVDAVRLCPPRFQPVEKRLPQASPGVSYGKQESKLGWNSQPTATVAFDGVRVPEANRLGDEGQGFSFAMKARTCADADVLFFGVCFPCLMWQPQWMGGASTSPHAALVGASSAWTMRCVW